MAPLALWSRRSKKDREELLKTVRRELQDALKRCGPKHEAGQEFICEDDALSVWSPQRIEILSKGLSWDEAKLQYITWDKFRKVLSILVWIRWDDWDDFKKIFLEHVDSHRRLDYNDQNLPFAWDTSFLHAHRLRSEFLNAQYIFSPIILTEDGPNHHSQNEYGYQYRMPFIESHKLKESTGDNLTRELVAAKHFRGKNGVLKPEQFWVSTKHIERGRISEAISRDFCRQQDALRVFKQTLEHDNIMLSWTTFSHGANFVVISPLADLKLHDFLTGKYKDFDVRHHRFTPFDLLRAISGVADALEFLHLRLNLRGRTMACAHVDLKPENILIQWELNGERLPGGRWLLQDFDIARIKESSEDPGPLAPADFLAHFSLAKLQANSTPFSAPESTANAPQKVGRERDMWSFGCLLALVLVFAVGGPSLVDNFTKSKDSTQPGRAPTEYFYMVEDGKAVLKPGVMNWLNSLRIESSECRWMGRVLDLVYGMLVESPADRLSARQAQEKLQLIWHEEQRFTKNRCSWISPEAPIAMDPELHPRVPDDGLIPIYTPESRPPISGHDQGLLLLGGPPQSKPAFEVEGLIPVNSEDHHYSRGQIPSTPIDDRRSSSSTGYSMGTGQSIYSTSDLKSSFVWLRTPPKPVRSLICGGRYASLSRHTAIVHSFGPEDRWSNRAPKSPRPLQQGSIAPQNIQCPQGFAEWDLASLCSDYIILRARNNHELKFIRYLCHRPDLDQIALDIWREDPFSTSTHGMTAPESISRIARGVLKVKINSRGDTLFLLDAGLCYYSTALGLHTLETEGQLREACFSADDRYIFAWTLGRHASNENRWYIWDAWTSVPIMNTSSPRVPAPRAGSGRNGLIFPFSYFFAAFEIPNRVYIIGKDLNSNPVIQLQSPIENIIAGATYGSSESETQGLILVQPGLSPRLINLQILPGSLSHISAKGQKLQERFNPDTDAITVVGDETGTYVVVSHPSGLIERRKIF